MYLSFEKKRISTKSYPKMVWPPKNREVELENCTIPLVEILAKEGSNGKEKELHTRVQS